MDIETLLTLLLPGQLKDTVEIATYYCPLGRAVRELRQPCYLLLELFLNFLIRLGFG